LQETGRKGTTNNVGIILAQDLIILLQDVFQFTVVLGLGLFYKTPERLHSFVVLSEAGNETFEAMIRSQVVSCPQA
jgi:hypothetical protein